MSKKKSRDSKKAAKTAPRGQAPTISLCMMVKNEEKRLPTALASAAPWVDEIVVVDTGSTDRTMEIAREYGARIFESPWRYDFSFHRNETIEHATSDWVLIMDADEELEQETAPLMKTVAAKAQDESKDINCIMFELYNDLSAGGESFILHPRLFRRGAIAYSGLVHNKPVITGKHAAAPIKLYHYGYNDDPETMAAKHKRRMEMIRHWTEQEPDSHMAHGYMAQTLCAEDERAGEALEEAEIAWRLAEEQKADYTQYPRFFYPMILALMILNRRDRLLEVAGACLKKVPMYPDPLYYTTWVHYQGKDWEKLIGDAEHFERLQFEAREKPFEFRFFENLTYDRFHQVYFRWAMAVAHLERREDFLAVVDKILAGKFAESTIRLLCQELLSHGLAQFMLEALGRAEAAGQVLDWMELAKKAAQEKLAAHEVEDKLARGRELLERGEYPAAAQTLREALELGGEKPDVMAALGRALYLGGQAERAYPYLCKAAGALLDDPEIWKLLADLSFERADHQAASHYYGRYQQLAPDDASAQARLRVCQRRATQAGQSPSVAARPPKLLIFLLPGMAQPMVARTAPLFLQGKAWGRFIVEEGKAPQQAPTWAEIFTGQASEEPGLAQDPPPGQTLSLAELGAPSFLEVLQQNGLKVGLMAAPYTSPPPNWPAWAVAGYPAGLLSPGAVWPEELLPQVLAAGFRSDFSLSPKEAEQAPQRLLLDREMARLLQVERRKLTTALTLPAVDVLVVGFSALEWAGQAARQVEDFRMFSIYQNVYSWLEMFLASPGAANFALLSNRGYLSGQSVANDGGFYCLSWLKGENLQARYRDIYPQILELFNLSH